MEEEWEAFRGGLNEDSFDAAFRAADKDGDNKLNNPDDEFKTFADIMRPNRDQSDDEDLFY
eukprot:NODE_3416_length_777_cov_74.587912_g2855_i0.p3 GENE.NODE_3416_length_777_cov_74.587912_g2855_i0~~NODE_3416_length_777_cov_74.587912_g2855_i0.p3  ORF type:complete len:61 (+),score=17.06 NODE_3416_length_777_cov_74.587912_g2855_i0:422-604(+)